MPVQPRTRRWYILLGVMLAQTVTIIVMLVIGNSLRDQVSEQREGARLAEVATCYAAARGRPRLITILRALEHGIEESARDEVRDLTDEYEARTPMIGDCDRLAARYGFDPADFPPPTPRGEEGK